MADHDHRHHHHRPHRLSLPPRTAVPATTPRPLYPPLTPTPTPSKHRASVLPLKSHSSSGKTSSFSFLFIILFSLRSLYSLLPFLRSSPSSFSIFPFAFLVSLFSFLLTLSFSLFTSSVSSSSRDVFRQKQRQPIFSLTLMTQSQHRLILAKSFLQAVIFLLRFQALRYCGTAAMILAEISGNVAARFIAGGKNQNRNFGNSSKLGSSKIGGFVALFLGLLFLSVSWDRIECFPLSSVNVSRFGISVVASKNCVRVWPMLLPFLSGFLGSYERISMNPATVREMGQKRVRLVTLFYTAVLLFIPAVISMFVFEAEGDKISLSNLGWPLVNTVVFGVLLSENCTDERLTASKDFQGEYLVTYVCTLILELFYFPELSLWGLLICGFLLWIAVRNLDPIYYNYLELGLESSEPLTAAVMKPLRHILGERKSRKIALFLLINTAYMVVEFFAGFMSNSLGLISDACHMLFDCAALAIGLYASYISRLPANVQFNYGRGRFEVLSGYVNAVFLVLVGALIVLESFERILDPQEISTNSLLTVSTGGLLVNIVGLIFFHEEHHHAHGGAGSCAHSHSHDHSHPVHNHQEECITVVHDCHEKVHSAHDKQCHSDREHQECSKVQHEHGSKTTHSHDHGHHHHHDDHSHDHGHHLHHHDDHSHDHGHHLHHHGDHSHGHGDHSHHECSHDADHHGHEKVNLNRGEKDKHHHHHHIDHNMQGIFLHVLADTLGSVGVVISTLLIKYKGWLVADPVCSIFISILIVSSVIPLLRNSAEILLQRVPRAHEHELKEAISNVMKMKGVCGIQSLHVWSFTNSDVVGTLRLNVSTETDKIDTKNRVSGVLHDAGIKDLTVQVECIKGS